MPRDLQIYSIFTFTGNAAKRLYAAEFRYCAETEPGHQAYISAPQTYNLGLQYSLRCQFGGIVPEETIFSKIIRKEIPADIVYEDDSVLAFNDIAPQAPVHILIIPKKPIPTVNDVVPEDEHTLGHMFAVAAKLAREHGVDESGYRLTVNCNSEGGQEVYHLHMHLLGGRRMQRMG